MIICWRGQAWQISADCQSLNSKRWNSNFIGQGEDFPDLDLLGRDIPTTYHKMEETWQILMRLGISWNSGIPKPAKLQPRNQNLRWNLIEPKLMVSGSHHFLSINSGDTSDSLARTQQGPWGVLRFLAALLRSLQHTSLPDEPCHCDQSSACRVYVGFSDSAWRGPERMPQNLQF